MPGDPMWVVGGDDVNDKVIVFYRPSTRVHQVRIILPNETTRRGERLLGGAALRAWPSSPSAR